MAQSARGEDFGEIVNRIETLAEAERSHAAKFGRTLDSIV
jgi:rubrerythrin